MCQLGRAKGCPDSWQNLTSGWSFRLFLEEAKIWISRPSKNESSHHGRWALSNPSRYWAEQKCGERANVLSAWGGTSFSPVLGHWCSSFLGLWPQTRTYIIDLLVLRPLHLGRDSPYQLSWAFGLQMADHGPSQPPYVCELIPHTRSLSTHLYIVPLLFLWRSLTNTMDKSGTQQLDA